VKRKGTSSSREAIASRFEIPEEAIPEEDYLAFIEPYEGLKHLEAIRASIAPENIVDMTKPSPVRARTFPDDLPFSKEETSAFRDLHKVLSSIISISGDTYAQQVLLKKRKEWMLKLLWAFGIFGELGEEYGSHLTIDSETYYAQLSGVPFYSNWEAVKHRFKILEEHGVHCDLVLLTEKSWLTPKGGLRKGTWFMKMVFNDNAGGVAALKALKSYTVRLNETYGKRAFRYFKNVDMRVLMKEVK